MSSKAAYYLTGMEHGMVNEMKHGTRNRTCNGTWKLEHAMEN